MTENKRFKSSTYQDALTGVYDKKENLTVNECCNLLNQLHEENEELKKDCTVLIYHNQEYRKENVQLKADKQSLIDFIKKEFPKSHKHILEGFE